ncbi:hypothetical protein Q5752_005716 [Cryptotrichosporon argae]
MRFPSSTRPTITPLGQRLLALSSAKLSSLDYPAPGARDEAHVLRRGVLVREAIRSAWRAVDDGSHAALSDWHVPGAMALGDVPEEDESSEDEFAAACAGPQSAPHEEERWFEDLISGLSSSEDEYDAPGGHQWVDSTVSMPDADDFEYEYEDDMVAFTLPPIASLAVEVQAVDMSYSVEVMSPDDQTLDLVDDVYDAFDAEVDAGHEMYDALDAEIDAGHETDCECGDDESEPPSPPTPCLAQRLHPPWPDWRRLSADQPPQPMLLGLSVVALPDAAVSDSASDHDDLDDLDPAELALPPPLVRSSSSGSSPSSSDDEGCVTPARSILEFAEEIGERIQKPKSQVEQPPSGLGLELGMQALAV